jgi:hypothetical protein
LRVTAATATHEIEHTASVTYLSQPVWAVTLVEVTMCAGKARGNHETVWRGQQRSVGGKAEEILVTEAFWAVVRVGWCS